jgi:hypothetical protein
LDLRGVALVIGFVFGRGCAAAGLSFRNVFHINPYAASGGGRATFVRGIVEYHAVDERAAAQRSNFDFDAYRELASALDQEQTDPDRLNLNKRANWPFQVAGC